MTPQAAVVEAVLGEEDGGWEERGGMPAICCVPVRLHRLLPSPPALHLRGRRLPLYTLLQHARWRTPTSSPPTSTRSRRRWVWAGRLRRLVGEAVGRPHPRPPHPTLTPTNLLCCAPLPQAAAEGRLHQQVRVWGVAARAARVGGALRGAAGCVRGRWTRIHRRPPPSPSRPSPSSSNPWLLLIPLDLHPPPLLLLLTKVWIIQEFANRGNLLDAIDRGAFRAPDGSGAPNLQALVATMLEIAGAPAGGLRGPARGAVAPCSSCPAGGAAALAALCTRTRTHKPPPPPCAALPRRPDLPALCGGGARRPHALKRAADLVRPRQGWPPLCRKGAPAGASRACVCVCVVASLLRLPNRRPCQDSAREPSASGARRSPPSPPSSLPLACLPCAGSRLRAVPPDWDRLCRALVWVWHRQARGAWVGAGGWS